MAESGTMAPPVDGVGAVETGVPAPAPVFNAAITAADDGAERGEFTGVVGAVKTVLLAGVVAVDNAIALSVVGAAAVEAEVAGMAAVVAGAAAAVAVVVGAVQALVSFGRLAEEV